MKLTAASSATLGAVTVTIKGVSDAQTASATVALTVQ